jgi:hypothetical protein
MALEPVAGSWPLFHCRNPIQIHEDPPDGGSARRNINAYTREIHALCGIRTHDPRILAGETALGLTICDF